MEDELNIFQIENDLIFFLIENDITKYFSSHGRQPQYSCEWKTTSKTKKQTMQPESAFC